MLTNDYGNERDGDKCFQIGDLITDLLDASLFSRGKSSDIFAFWRN